MPEETIHYTIHPSAESTFTLEVFKTGLQAGKKHFLFFEQYRPRQDQPASRALEIDGDAQINLKDYGLKPPSSMLGLIGTKSKMTLRFLVWAEKTTS